MISVAVGDKVKKSQCLAMHEYSDNGYSTREIKSPCEGTVEKILREVGNKDNTFSIIMIIKKDSTSEF